MKKSRFLSLIKKPWFVVTVVLCAMITAGIIYFSVSESDNQITDSVRTGDDDYDDDDDLLSHLSDTTGMVMPDSSVYEGSILIDTKQPHGYGVLTRGGTRYDGEWEHGQLTYGKRTGDESVYTGHFDSQLRNHGYGVVEYTRHYVEGKRNSGKSNSEIVLKYAGSWNHDRKHGLGKTTRADSTIVFGRYVNGIYQHVPGARYNISDKVYGIDLSHHNRKIDWANLALYCNADGEVFHKGSGKKKYMQPVSFVYLKATEGGTHRDTTYHANALAADRHGIAKGAYHFLRLGVPTADQVKNFIETVNWQPGDMPPVLDVELPHEIRAHGTGGVFDWLEAVEKELGVRPIIYTGENIRDKYLASDPRFKKYHCWIARYNPAGPKNSDWKIWQMSDKGRGSGHSGNIDINVFQGNQKEFARYLNEVSGS